MYLSCFIPSARSRITSRSLNSLIFFTLRPNDSTETNYGRQERMYQLIRSLGAKPTNSKDVVYRQQKRIENKVESFTINDNKDAKSAENEIHKIKEDLIIEIIYPRWLVEPMS